MKILYVLLLATTVGLVLPSVAASDAAGARRTTSLNGTEEILGGDSDGSGFALIRLNVGRERVCWDLSVSNIAPATAAHIHAAPVGVNGPIVVPLSPPTTGSSAGCRNGVDRGLIQAIIDFPENYYVNVHNANFPGGALRGQLSNPGLSD